MHIEWQKRDGMFVAQIGDVTLCASPDRYAKGFTPKAARGTKWRAQCSHWNERTRTLSRYGRDEYSILYDDARSAMRAAEGIYNCARQCPHGELLANRCRACEREHTRETC